MPTPEWLYNKCQSLPGLGRMAPAVTVVPSMARSPPRVRKRLTDIGQEIFPPDKQSPEALHAFHKAEIDKWWPIIKAAGIKAE